LDWTDKHREQINSVKTVADLNALLGHYPGLVDEFVAFAAKNGVRPDYNYKQIEISRAVLSAQLRAGIGRNTNLDYTGFYAEIYPIDTTLLKAIEVLNNNLN
jgi:carboxyl-terminal processing protease